jgi:hypothetical protein
MKRLSALLIACGLAGACADSNPVSSLTGTGPSSLGAPSPGGVFSTYAATDPNLSCPHPAMIGIKTNTNGTQSVNVEWSRTLNAANFLVEILLNNTNTIAKDSDKGKLLTHVVDGSKWYDDIQDLSSGVYWARVTSKSCDELGTPSVQTPESTFTIVGNDDQPAPDCDEEGHGGYGEYGAYSEGGGYDMCGGGHGSDYNPE